MQDFLVGLIGFLKNPGDLFPGLSGCAGGFGNELDQITGILQKRLYLGDIGKIIPASFGRDGQVASFLNEETGTVQAFNGGNETGHKFLQL
jgi:hypothetical protein